MSMKSKVHNELFKMKILYRNMKAKPVRKEQAKSAINTLVQFEHASKKIFFCGIPMHKNLGDQGQRYCIEKWCRDNYPDYQILAIPTWAFYERKFQRKLENEVTNNDIFVIQSGYCTTSRHYDHPMHRYIVSTFKKNPILVMPQTVRFVDDKDGYKTGCIYGLHHKLLFLARDKVSYESAKKYFPENRVLLYPDIVTTLIGTWKENTERDGVLLCIRNDGEKKYGNEQIELLKKKFESNGNRCEITDTNSDLDLNIIIEQFDTELKSVIEYFASFKVIITDRYHGTIFSMISNTPVIVLATKDHKVKTGTEWFKGVYDGAYCNADSIEEAFRKAQEILCNNVCITNRGYFKERYYDTLKDEFERTINSNE